ncbi:hypothetical protein MNV49_007593 [Pseudohyphozyma bogoriensis]|nr:hypothetical protein MNV49_007593 [Pseudohyphozyma bogoriensis]
MSPKLLVRGSINIDEFFSVPHIIAPGETLSSTGYTRRAGGKGANLSVAAAKAGSYVVLSGFVGNDGGWVRDLLSENGVGVDLLGVDENLPTGRAVIQLDSSSGENSIILLAGSNYSPSPLPFPPASAGYTHLSLQNEIPLPTTISYLETAHERKMSTFFNPSPMLSKDEIVAFPWTAVTWLVVNEGEAITLLAALAAGTSTASASPEEILKLLVKHTKTEGGIVMTLGSAGAMACWKGEVVRCGAGKVLNGVKDTTGAGDCFAGYFAHLVSTNPPTTPAELEDSMKIASQAAAICVEKEGALDSYPTMAQVVERLL